MLEFKFVTARARLRRASFPSFPATSLELVGLSTIVARCRGMCLLAASLRQPLVYRCAKVTHVSDIIQDYTLCFGLCFALLPFCPCGLLPFCPFAPLPTFSLPFGPFSQKEKRAKRKKGGQKGKRERRGKGRKGKRASKRARGQTGERGKGRAKGQKDKRGKG